MSKRKHSPEWTREGEHQGRVLCTTNVQTEPSLVFCCLRFLIGIRCKHGIYFCIDRLSVRKIVYHFSAKIGSCLGVSTAKKY
jgi:hypothetical protein